MLQQYAYIYDKHLLKGPEIYPDLKSRFIILIY